MKKLEHNQYLRGDVFHEWTHILSYRYDREYREKLLERCKFVFSCLTPKAIEALKQYQSSENRVEKGRTRRLLKFIQDAQQSAGTLE